MIRPAVFVSALMAVLGAGVLTAAADEAKTPLSASMILSIVSAPVSTRASAYDAGLKDPAAAAPNSTTGEVLADGSVRYGRTIITVRNPCPPGEHLETPIILPGRRNR
ncbi:MAG TPA: hypothetical protein VGQ77_00285 [Methylomirabilota bacterium]|jgi:hypothetical protein|nr:hypothetical protein [Methylomirabilota bacterium]